jgi:hypothetical protein
MIQSIHTRILLFQYPGNRKGLSGLNNNYLNSPATSSQDGKITTKEINMGNEIIFFDNLIQSLQLLSAAYSVQTDVLPDYVDKPDEVALTFYDCFLLADQILEANLITMDQYKLLEDIDRKLAMMSSVKKYWTLESLSQDPEWQELRLLAKNILTMLRVTQERPNLDWISFTKG